MIVVPFISVHLQDFNIQKEQMFLDDVAQDQGYLEMLEDNLDSWSIMHEGRPIAFAGMHKFSYHIGKVWAILSEDCCKYMLPTTRIVRNWLDDCKMQRVETAVRRDFAQGHRWAKLLGFQNETADTGMSNYGVNGETYDLYSRVNNG